MGHWHLNSTVVLIVSNDLSFPDEQCVVLVQSSKMLPCGYKPFARFATVDSRRQEGGRAVAVGRASFLELVSGFPCSLRSQGKWLLWAGLNPNMLVLDCSVF